MHNCSCHVHLTCTCVFMDVFAFSLIGRSSHSHLCIPTRPLRNPASVRELQPGLRREQQGCRLYRRSLLPLGWLDELCELARGGALLALLRLFRYCDAVPIPPHFSEFRVPCYVLLAYVAVFHHNSFEHINSYIKPLYSLKSATF